MQISQGAKQALINAGTNRQGARVAASLEIKWELEAAGLIGRGTGLTRKGSIVREQTVAEALDRAFG